MTFFIEKIIFHNRAPFEHLEIEFKRNNITLLNAYNGGGKTTIISHIVDAFIELARPFYENEFENRKNKYYRVSSSLYSLNLAEPSFVYIRFNFSEKDDQNVEVIDYVDVREQCSIEQYNNAIQLEDKIDFGKFSNLLKNNTCVKIFSENLTKEKVYTIFESNVLTFFPAYRFEYPGYLNDAYRESIKYENDLTFSGYLPNPIEVVTDFPHLTNWMMDVLLDWLNNKKTTFLREGIQLDVTPEKTNIWNTIILIINKSLVNREGGALRLGIGRRTNPGQRICIMRDKDQESDMMYPSIFNISSGEMAIISLFGELLRQADSLGKTSNISGIVLIDEIDKHLHIQLQKEILPSLFNIFPNIQFIVSSHSPFVAMGLNEQTSNRFSMIYLSNKTGSEIVLDKNPLYEEVYKMMLKDNENYKNAYEKLISSNGNSKQLLVEDKYDQIYKIAWLKIKDIAFDINTIESAFQENAPFEIINDNASGGIAGCLNVRNPNLFNGRIIVGLFDFDYEGSENFYNVKEGFTKDEILGDLTTGFYRKKNTSSNVKIYGLMLPVPQRLHFLVIRSSNDYLWKGDGKFSNFVEVETLLQEEYLKTNNDYEKDNIAGRDYYKAKDKKKDKLWKPLIDQPKDVFTDFIPLFEKIYELFEIGEF